MITIFHALLIFVQFSFNVPFNFFCSKGVKMLEKTVAWSTENDILWDILMFGYYEMGIRYKECENDYLFGKCELYHTFSLGWVDIVKVLLHDNIFTGLFNQFFLVNTQNKNKKSPWIQPVLALKN